MNPFRCRAAIVTIAIVSSLACAPTTTVTPGSTLPGGSSQGIDLAGMDHSVAPGTDFFAHANGSWIRTTAIPPDRSAYGVGAMLVELTQKRTAALIQGARGAAAARRVRGAEDQRLLRELHG